MDWVAFENDRQFVLEGLRRGEVDYVEHVSEAAEADLFRHLVSRDVLTRLPETYATPRKKEEVPVWLYLASQISPRCQLSRLPLRVALRRLNPRAGSQCRAQGGASGHSGRHAGLRGIQRQEHPWP